MSIARSFRRRLRPWFAGWRTDPLKRHRIRVLYALESFPQLSQSYIRAEISCLTRAGAHVEVWSERQPPSRYETRVLVHRGSLERAIRRVRPDIVHVHWLHKALLFRDAIDRLGKRMTVRGHNFDHDLERVAALQDDPVVSAIYLYPHLAKACPEHWTKVQPMPVAFDPALYHPETSKDRRLVVRAGPSLPEKDLESFVRLATLLPKHRFVMAVARTRGNYSDALAEFNRCAKRPVDLHFNLDHEAAAALVGEATVYFYTNSLTEPFGMPVSIVEAMATGGYVLTPRCPGAEAMVGEAGACYDTVEEAAKLIAATETWSDAKWRGVRHCAIERAYRMYCGRTVFGRLLSDWCRLADPNAPSGSPPTGRMRN